MAASTSNEASTAVVEDPAVRPFRVEVREEDLVELRRRIAATRWPERETVADVMGAQAPPELLGIHSNMPGTVPPRCPRHSGPAVRRQLAFRTTSNASSSSCASSTTKGIGYATEMGLSSGRLYWENTLGFFDVKGATVPAAVTVFPNELYQAPRSWVEQAYPNLTYFNEADKGGHFAAWEEPQLFSEEVRAAFRLLR